MNSNNTTLINDSKPVKKNNKKKIQELDSARINDFENHLKVNNTKDADENTSMASASKGSKKSAKTGSKNNFENNEIKLQD